MDVSSSLREIENPFYMWVKMLSGFFFLIARNSMCDSPLPDFLMEFRRDDSEDAFDIHNTWNIALLLVTVYRLRCWAARAQLPLYSESCAKFQLRKMANHTSSDDLVFC